MKSYTDLEQSKVLAKILPLRSADMCYYEYTSHIDGTPKVGYKEGITEGIPCWSLAALLGVIKPINENTYTIRGTLDGGAIISFDEITNIMFQEEEIINAAFKLVCWLLENKEL